MSSAEQSIWCLRYKNRKKEKEIACSLPIRGTESDVAGMISATSSMKTVRDSNTVIPVEIHTHQLGWGGQNRAEWKGKWNKNTKSRAIAGNVLVKKLPIHRLTFSFLDISYTVWLRKHVKKAPTSANFCSKWVFLYLITLVLQQNDKNQVLATTSGTQDRIIPPCLEHPVELM